MWLQLEPVSLDALTRPPMFVNAPARHGGWVTA